MSVYCAYLGSEAWSASDPDPCMTPLFADLPRCLSDAGTAAQQELEANATQQAEKKDTKVLSFTFE